MFVKRYIANQKCEAKCTEKKIGKNTKKNCYQ